MREIKFRGKDYEDKWRQGDLVQEKWGQGKAIMIKKDKRAWSVLEDTVGQYTGLKDKNGKEIYEGDIVNIIHRTGFHKGIPLYAIFVAKIIYSPNYASFIVQNCKPVDIKHECENLGDYEDIEVIGNIYDNPELLEV